MNLTKFVNTETGKHIMSILLGFGLASLFRRVCKGKRCVIYHAPPLEEIKDQTFKYGDKCYKFEMNNTKCDTKKQIVEFD